jgi:hypothetical protein
MEIERKGQIYRVKTDEQKKNQVLRRELKQENGKPDIDEFGIAMSPDTNP